MRPIILLAVYVMIILGGLAHAQERGTERVTLQLKWKHQFQFAGYYAAIEKGYYAAEGLDVKLVEATQESDVATEVFGGRAEFGVATSDVILMKNSGQDPVIIASIFQHSPLVIVGSVKAGISNIHHLKGKRIAMEENEGDLLAYLASEGLGPDTYTRLKHSFSIKDLIEGKVDAMTAYATDELYQLDSAGYEYKAFSATSTNIDFYGDVLFTSRSLIKEKPVLVEKFRRATVRGWKYAMRHVDEMIDIILTKYSQRKTREHLKYEATTMKVLLLPGVVEPGYFSEGRWQTILETFIKAGLVSEDLTIDGMLYNHYTEPAKVPWGIISLVSGAFIISWLIFFLIYLSRKRFMTELELNKQLTEKLAAANADKDKFFSIIAHDLRNPFMGLLNYSAIIEEEIDNLSKDEIREMAGNLRRISAKTYSLLNDLLSWAKFKSGKAEFSPENIDLNDLVEEKIIILKPQADAKGVKLISKVKPGLMITGDRKMMSSVVLNLLTNGVKFTSRDGKVEIQASESEGSVEIVVSDTGIGIPDEMIPRLFSIVEKTGRTGTDGEAGSGLGLLLCKEFVEKHGGEIRVESKAGEGSKFFFSLPAGSSAESRT